MRIHIVMAAAIGVVLGYGGRADADLITFDDIPHSEAVLTTLDYGGYHFESDHFHTHGTDRPSLVAGFSSNETTHLGYESGRGDPIVMSRLDGALFSLMSLDVAEFFAFGGPPDRPNAELLEIRGEAATGTIVYTLSLDSIVDGPGGAVDFQHFVLPSTFENLISVTFTGLRLDGSSGGIDLDNLYVSVPEPTSAAVVALGLALIGTRAARRRMRARRA